MAGTLPKRLIIFFGAIRNLTMNNFYVKILLISLMLNFAASYALAASPADQPKVTNPNDRKAIIGFNSFLLGGFIDGRWVSADDLQKKTEYHSDRVWGGEEYSVYSAKGFQGIGKGSAIHREHPGEFESEPTEPDAPIFDLTLENGQTLGFGSARLAVRCDWDPAPRQATGLETKDTVYNKIVKDYLERNGLPGATPNIMQLFKVDLNGDGVDEVVIVAQNIVGPDTAPAAWEADKPFSIMTSISGGSKKGNYSLVLLRKIVNGKVREIPLAQFIALKDAGPDEDQAALAHKVHQFADLNGDGVMEIIISAVDYSDFKHLVFEIEGDKAVEVLKNGAAAASHALAIDQALTLKDSERGTTVGLYPTGEKEDLELLLYVNERFGYSVKVPYELFTEVVVLPDNGDGIILESKEGLYPLDPLYRFRTSGGLAMSADMLETSLKDAKKQVEENVEGAIAYEKRGDDWWQLWWWNGSEKGSRKFMTNGEVWGECEITGPGLPRNAPGEYDDLLDRALESLTLAAPAAPRVKWGVEAPKVELTICNEEQIPGRVALACREGALLVVEGWHRLAPGQTRTIILDNVSDGDVYIYVEFDDPAVKQFVDYRRMKLEGQVLDKDFRYTREAVGGRGAPKYPNMREVHFYQIDKLYQTGKGEFWFNLSAAAG